MYAIVDIAGQQFKVEKDKKVYINRINGEIGSKVDLEKVLFINNGGEVKIGSPYLKDAVVTCKILSHFKDKKIIVFKKKRRKGYKVLNGHRQFLTEVLIENISEKRTAREPKGEKEDKKKIPLKKEAVEVKIPEKEAIKKTDDARPAEKATADSPPSEKKVKAKTGSPKKVTAAKKEGPTKTAAKKAEQGKTEQAKKKPASAAKSKVSKQPKSRNTKKNN